MNISIVKADLAASILSLKKAKIAIEFATREGRLLLDLDDYHELKELALILGADVATIESHLGSYGRMFPASKKFAVISK